MGTVLGSQLTVGGVNADILGSIIVGSGNSLIQILGNSQAIVDGGDVLVSQQGSLIITEESTLIVSTGTVSAIGPEATIEVTGKSKLVNDGKLVTSSVVRLPSGNSMSIGSSGVLHVQGPVSIVGDGDDDLGTIDSDGTLLFDA